MAKKKTVAELEAAAKAAEQRARELRKKAAQQTAAEKAKINTELIAALAEWVDAYPPPQRIDWADLPNYFREQAEKVRQHYANQQGGE